MLHLKSLRLKLIACFLMLTLLPITTTTFYGHFFTRTALSDQALERSAYQVDLQVESIAASLRQVQSDAVYLGAMRSLTMFRQQTIPEDIDLWGREVASDLLVMTSVRAMYYSVRLIDQNGNEMVGVQADGDQVVVLSELTNRRSDAYFSETMRLEPGGVFVSPFQLNTNNGVPYIHYALRLPDSVLVIDLHAGWLLRSLPQHPGADTWALLDQDGHFLVYPAGFQPSSIIADVPHLLVGHAGRYETEDSVYIFDIVSPATVTEPSTLGVSPRYWVVFRRTPITVLYAELNDFYRLALIFVIASALIAIWFAVTISQWLTIPVRRLQRMALQFGRDGKVMALPSNLSGDEIGALTRSFIDMSHELDVKRRKEHQLLESLINAQEEERKLLAYDLHDGLIQQMVGARFYLKNFDDEDGDADPMSNSSAKTDYRRGYDALTQAIIEGRRIIEGLRPAVLDDLGLTAAIEEITQTTAAAASWTLTLDLQKLPGEPEKMVAVTLFRIAQEALNNIRNHANATTVRVTLHNGDGIHLMISDNGRGFDPHAINNGDGRGIGITAMQERAALLHGECKICSTPESGTQIAVRIPYTWQERT